MALLDKNGRPIHRDNTPVLQVKRAMGQAVKDRAAAAPPVPIHVTSLRSELAHTLYPNSSPDMRNGYALASGFDLKIAPVLAAGQVKYSGLVLSGQDVVVGLIHGTPQGSIYHHSLNMQYMSATRPSVWGADETFKVMAVEDWGFVVGCEPNLVIPAVVTSRIHTLAYYQELFTKGPHGLAVLQRWGDAIERVRMGIDLVDSLYGPLHFQRAKPLGGTEMDFTVEDVLRTRRRARILVWANMARTVADAATQTRKKMTEEWFALHLDHTNVR